MLIDEYLYLTVRCSGDKQIYRATHKLASPTLLHKVKKYINLISLTRENTSNDKISNESYKKVTDQQDIG